MSLQFCISRRGSYSETVFAYYIDDSILNNTETFSAYMATGGAYRQFKLPVGVFYYNPSADATYLSVIAKNNFNGCLVWYEDETRREKATNAENPNAMGTSFGVQKPATFGTAIPFFNNDVDASNYSMGLPYNAENWVGGKPLTPPYNWQSVPSISGKNGILSLPVLIDTDGEPVSSGSASDFSTLPSGAKVRTLADANI